MKKNVRYSTKHNERHLVRVSRRYAKYCKPVSMTDRQRIRIHQHEHNVLQVMAVVELVTMCQKIELHFCPMLPHFFFKERDLKMSQELPLRFHRDVEKKI